MMRTKRLLFIAKFLASCAAHAALAGSTATIRIRTDSKLHIIIALNPSTEFIIIHLKLYTFNALLLPRTKWTLEFFFAIVDIDKMHCAFYLHTE